MNKALLAAFALLTTATFVACDDAGNEYHGTTIVNRNQTNAMVMYADQTIDSLCVVSFDSWTAELQNIEGGEWCKASVTKCDVPVGYQVAQSVYIETTPNTTGLNRYAGYYVHSSYPEFGVISSGIYQYAWLHITVPEPSFTSQTFTEAKAEFKAQIPANATTAPLAFYVFADATLTSDAEWLTIPEDVKTVKRGEHGIQLVTTANPNVEERVAHVTLTSNGVSNVITYVQKGK